ncbi:hypothetical protein V6N13_025751 [Hibiscus sabdariffa]
MHVHASSQNRLLQVSNVSPTALHRLLQELNACIGWPNLCIFCSFTWPASSHVPYPCTAKHRICSSGAAGHEFYPCINLQNSCTAKHRICSPGAEGDMSAMNLGRLLQLPICYNYKWSPPAEDEFL